MYMDYLKDLNELALGSRLKRMSDAIMREVLVIYQECKIDFEPVLMPVFNYLHKNSEASITQIASALSISQPAVSQFISHLAKKGYVKLTVDKTDTRKRIAQLTKKGNNLIEVLNPIWKAIDAEVKALVKEPELNLLHALNGFESHFNKVNFSERILSKLKAETEGEVKIIPYSEKYKDDIRRLNYEWLEKYFSIEPGDKISLANPKKEIIDKGGYIFYALYNGEVVGTACLLKITDTVYELGKMAVTEKCQGKKIGQKLMDSSLKKAKELGLEKLILYSNTKLASAVNLYFKNGYRVVDFGNAPYKRSNIKMELTLS